MTRVVVVAVLVLATCLMLTVYDVEGKKSKKAGGKAGWKVLKRRMHTVVKDLESNVTALWGEVKQLSQPVHVHLHGDSHLMNPDRHHEHHDHHDHHDHDDHHHNEEHHHHDDDQHSHDKHKMADAEKDQKKHDDEDHDEHYGDKKSHPSHEDKMKMKLKKMKHGHDEQEEEEEEEEHWGHHQKRMGTHVHIHLHTGMEEEEEEKRHHALPREFRYARCDVVTNSALPVKERENIKGTIFFRQMPDEPVEGKAILEGFKPRHERANKDQKHLRGLHGHEFGDLTNGCISLGGHINPLGVSHGGPEAEHRHLGDFGNIEVRDNGTAMMSFTDDVASLFGSDSLLGRSMVIHTGADDLGGGHSAASKRFGNAGGRSACCVIVACPQPAVWTGDEDGGQPASPANPGHHSGH